MPQGAQIPKVNTVMKVANKTWPI
jgi:hypothetical protein